MAFRNGAIATVWGVEDKGNYVSVRLTTSRKNKEGNYEQDFSGFCSFIGNSKPKAVTLKEKDRIKLGDVSVSNRYNKEASREYVSYTVFDFEPLENSKASSSKSAPVEVDGNTAEGDEELPF